MENVIPLHGFTTKDFEELITTKGVKEPLLEFIKK